MRVKVKPTNKNSGKIKLFTTFIGALSTAQLHSSAPRLLKQVKTGATNF